MGVIDDFVSEYEREFDYWEALARTARGLLEAELGSSGIRAIVTSRAKSVERLLGKLQARNRSKSYDSLAEIRRDIADLAGVRVALYFPGQMSEVENVVRQLFLVRGFKRFPSEVQGQSRGPSRAEARAKRFSGYGARHFRVEIPESRLSAGEIRYSSAPIEIQVASVLMHAWSEVEHDLVYKPLEGALSASEYALLDQLNGLMLAGEIALEQLQKAGDARVASTDTTFRNHYELAEFLRTRLAGLGKELTDATLGRVDVLSEYLEEQGVATATSVEPYLSLLERDFEHRPVAAQLADLMLSGNQSRYNAFLKAATAVRYPSRRRVPVDNATIGAPYSAAVGKFVVAWVLFEALMNSLLPSDGPQHPPVPVLLGQLRARDLVLEQEYEQLTTLRNLRNRVVHGAARDITSEELSEAAVLLQEVTAQIRRRAEMG